MTKTLVRRGILVPLFAILLLCYRSPGVERVDGRIMDEKTGQPVAATLLLSDQEGKMLEIDGKHPHVQYLGKRRCYVDGTFTLSARPRELVVEIRRGLETLPIQSKIDLSQTSGDALTFRMRRWTDMRERGYMNGDTHVHFLTQAESHLQMRA